MPPDFLNSREDAILFWALVFVGWLLSTDARGILAAVLQVIRAALHRKLVFLFASALAYCAFAVYFAHELGVWHMTTLKPTIYWFVGTAIVLVGDAVTADPTDTGLVRRVLGRVVAVTIFVEFAVGLYALPFAVEVLLVFVVIVCSVMSAAPAIGGIAGRVLVAIGFVYVINFVVRVLGDPARPLTGERVEELAVGPALTVALIPFLYAVAWLSRHEQARVRRRWRTASNPT